LKKREEYVTREIVLTEINAGISIIICTDIRWVVAHSVPIRIPASWFNGWNPSYG